jgi:hypothetical protein
VTGAADEAEVAIPALEHVYDCLRRGEQAALGTDDEGPSKAHHPISVFDKRVPEVLVKWNDPARLALAGGVQEVDGPANLALGVVGHEPSQSSDFLGPQACLDRQKEDEPVSLRVPRAGEIRQHRVDLALAQRFSLLA